MDPIVLDPKVDCRVRHQSRRSRTHRGTPVASGSKSTALMLGPLVPLVGFLCFVHCVPDGYHLWWERLQRHLMECLQGGRRRRRSTDHRPSSTVAGFPHPVAHDISPAWLGHRRRCFLPSLRRRRSHLPFFWYPTEEALKSDVVGRWCAPSCCACGTKWPPSCRRRLRPCRRRRGCPRRGR